MATRKHDWLESVLGLSHDNVGRVSVLFACMFLVITSSVLGKVARDALFLSRFDARLLPWADLSVALLVAVVVGVYVRISRHVYLRDVLVASMVFFSASCATIWSLARSYDAAWTYPLLYVWVGILAVLAPAQVWTLANYILTSREARRVFGIVGAGATFGCITAGVLTTSVVRRVGTENLLLCMAVPFAACGALVIVAWRSAPAITAEVEHECSADAPRDLRESAAAVFSSPYLRVIAAVIFLSSLTTTVIGWQFKAIASQFVASGAALALFFGRFNLYAGILSFAVQVLFASRMLRRFGIGPVLFCLPVSLFVASAGVALSGGLLAMVVLRGADQVLRYSLDKPSVELLYVPVAARMKVQVKWFIDTVLWRAGDGIAAASLLFFVSLLQLPARSLGWMISLVAGLWACAAWGARHLYVAALKQSIDAHASDLTRASVAAGGHSATDIVVAKLRDPSDREVLYALDLVHVEDRTPTAIAVRELLSHPQAAIRAKALTVLGDSGDGSALPQARLWISEADRDIREAAIRYLCRYSRFDPLIGESWSELSDPTLRCGIVEFLARPGPTQNLDAAGRILTAMVEDPDPRTRVGAVQVLASVPNIFPDLLQRLIADTDPGVAGEAMRACASRNAERFAPHVLARVGERGCRAAAIETLVCFGDKVASLLANTLADARVSRDARTAVVSVLDRIGTQTCVDILESTLLEPDATVRHAMLNALAALRRCNSSLAIDPAYLESLLVAEVYGNYRTFQVHEAFRSAGIQDKTLFDLLAEGVALEQERIFRILSTLYPRRGFRAAYEGLRSGQVTIHDNALEFVENLLKPTFRELIVPLLDPAFTAADRAHLAGRLLMVETPSVDEAIFILLCSGDRKLQMCGWWAIGLAGDRNVWRSREESSGGAAAIRRLRACALP